MIKTYSMLSATAAIVLSLGAAVAFADDFATGIESGAASSPTLTANPSARAAVDKNEVNQIDTGPAVSREKFIGTLASMHTEDQCTMFNLGVSRFVPPIGLTTTFLSYTSVNLCDPTLNASGNLEIPDESFTGDPRTDKKLSLKIDLSSPEIVPSETVGASPLVLGPQLVADLTFSKTPDMIGRSNFRSVYETLLEGVKKVLTFNTVTVMTTAGVSGTASLSGPTVPLPLGDKAKAEINWDDTVNTTSVQ